MDAATDDEIQHHFNELKRELLNDQAKTLDRWLTAVTIVLTALSVIAVFLGYIGFNRFREIETEARQNVAKAQHYVEEIKKKRDKATLLVKDVEELATKVAVNDLKKAGETAKRVYENPESSPIDRAIATAVLLQRDQKIEEAIEKWRSIANVVEETNTELGSQAWLSAGYLYGMRGDFEAARNASTQAIRLNPGFAVAYNNRGNAKDSLGQFEAAIADYNTALQLNPNFAVAYYNRGRTNKRLGRVNEARQDFDTAINLFRNAGNEDLATAAEQQLRALDNP